MRYVQGFILAVPEENKEAYRENTEQAWAFFKAQGALSTCENWEADVPDGKVTSFPMAVKRAPGEKIVFSWIVWPDKATHDAAWKTLMQSGEMADMPFDGMRMMWGGFEPLFEG